MFFVRRWRHIRQNTVFTTGAQEAQDPEIPRPLPSANQIRAAVTSAASFHSDAGLTCRLLVTTRYI